MIEQLFPGGKSGGTVDTIQAGTGISVDATNPASPIVSSTVVDTNDAAKVSSNDTTAGYLNGKLVAGSNITLTENNNGGNETLTIAAAGGVTGFTGSQNTASPNNTVNASRLLVDATSTDADAVIQPKGGGALLAQLSDGGTTGGNKRGYWAVDLQLGRTSNTHVASANYSVVVGGQSNRASDLRAAVVGGTNNAATNDDSGVFAGSQNTASGVNSVVIGGSQNTATGISSVAGGTGSDATGNDAVAFGSNTTASGAASFAMGADSQATSFRCVAIGTDARATENGAIALGYGARADKHGKLAWGTWEFAAKGDVQVEQYQVLRITTDATQTELTADKGVPAAATRMSISSDSTYTFWGLVTARRTDADNESAGYKIEGVIDNNAGTTAFVGTPTVTILGEDTAAWDVVVEADDTNDALVIKVTGEANKTIRWAATVTLMKVTG